MLDPVLVAASSAVFYGTSVFIGGRAAFYIGTVRALVILQLTGVITSFSLVMLLGQIQGLKNLSIYDFGLSALSGLSFAIGCAFLAQGLSLGRTTVVAPMESLIARVFAAMLEGVIVGWPSTNAIFGILIAATAAGLIGLGANKEGGEKSVVVSIALGGFAGLSFGVSYLTIGFVTPSSGVNALFITRLFAAAGLLAWVAMVAAWTRVLARSVSDNLASRRANRGKALAVCGGIIDVAGNLAFVMATGSTLVGVSVAVVSLYAAVTVVLGIVFLRERPSTLQSAGLLIGSLAVVVLTLGR